MSNMEYIRLEGSLVLPAKVDGASDVFQCPQFTLVSPEWVPDKQSNYCELCSTKFTQIKRRHHCRMCGAVRCAKCCNEKVPLPQLGLEEPERVCESCKTVTELVSKARSSIEAYRIESAQGLSAFARHDKHIKKLVELGGVQALVILSSNDNDTILGHVVSGIHSLSTHPSLHKYLAETGAIKAICKTLSKVGDSDEQIAVDGISAFMIFCRDSTLKTKALNDGGLQPVLNLCWSKNESIALVSISTLGLIAEHLGTHNAIIENRHNALSRLMQLTVAPDEQMQEVALKTLAYLSTGTETHKHRLIEEDLQAGSCILRVFDSNPNNPQILCNASCLVANLATSVQDQDRMQALLQSVCRKLGPAESSTELLCHLTRALANFAQHEQNTAHLINVIPEIVRYCLKSSTSPIQDQSMRLLLTLLSCAPARVAALLMSDGGQTFLTCLGDMPSFRNAFRASLTNEIPSISKPL